MGVAVAFPFHMPLAARPGFGYASALVVAAG